MCDVLFLLLKIARKGTPLAARAQHVQNSAKNLIQIDRARLSSLSNLLKLWADGLELLSSNITWI